MTEVAFLNALRVTLVGALSFIDARLEALTGKSPLAGGPQCPRCQSARHVAEAGDGFVCGECEHAWEPGA